MAQEVLGDDFLRGHVGDTDQGQYLVGPTGGQQGARQLQRVGGDDVVVGEPMVGGGAAGQLGRQGQQRVGVVDMGRPLGSPR